MVSYLVPRIPCLRPWALGFQASHLVYLVFHLGSKKPNSYPHACMTRSLPAGPSACPSLGCLDSTHHFTLGGSDSPLLFLILGFMGQCGGAGGRVPKSSWHTPVFPALQKLRQEDAKFQHGHIAISSSKTKQSPRGCCVAGVGGCGDLIKADSIAYSYTPPELSRED